MLVPQFGQVHPPPRNSLRLTGFLRCSCSRPHPGQVTFRSNPLPATTSQTEFRLRPHFPDLPAVSVAIISKTPPSTTATITLKRNIMLSILEKLRCVRMTFPAFACVVKSVRQTKPTVSRERPLRDSYFGTVAGSYGRFCIGTAGNGHVSRHRQLRAGRYRPIQANQPHGTLRSTVALNDIQNRILAQPEPVADLPIELAFADEL
jgi:hypothetical protein